MWWAPRTGMLSVRCELPDLDGARFEATISHLVDRMRPVKGQPWDTREHRGADALVRLCELDGNCDAATACRSITCAPEVGAAPR